MRAQPKWEDLELDCLVNIVGRVGMDSLVLNVPFVCKSWYKASLNPSCWLPLHFAAIGNPYSKFECKFMSEYDLNYFSATAFVNFIAHRGLGNSTSVVLRRGYCEKELKLIAEKCPEVKSLSLKWGFVKSVSSVPESIGKLKLLEELSIHLTYDFPDLVAKIGYNCDNFHTLSISGELTMQDALAIVNHLPKLENLSLVCCLFEQEYLEIILRGCKELQVFDMKKCNMANQIWEENKIKQLASHINAFNLDIDFSDSNYHGAYYSHIYCEMDEIY